MTGEELQTLRSEDLLSLARNPSATVKRDALRLLIERASPHAAHPDVAEEAKVIILNDPGILKKADPGSIVFAHKLPGVLDVIVNEAAKTKLLESKAVRFADHIEQLVAADNKLYKADLDARIKTYELVGEISDEHQATKEELLKTLEHLQYIADEYGNRLEAAEIRLALLERSLWRKIVDWVKGLTC